LVTARRSTRFRGRAEAVSANLLFHSSERAGRRRCHRRSPRLFKTEADHCIPSRSLPFEILSSMPVHLFGTSRNSSAFHARRARGVRVPTHPTRNAGGERDDDLRHPLDEKEPEQWKNES
jgi:hypothetical protein